MKLTIPAIRAVAEERQPSEVSEQARKMLEDIDALLAEILLPAATAPLAGA